MVVVCGGEGFGRGGFWGRLGCEGGGWAGGLEWGVRSDAAVLGKDAGGPRRGRGSRAVGRLTPGRGRGRSSTLFPLTMRHHTPPPAPFSPSFTRAEPLALMIRMFVLCMNTSGTHTIFRGGTEVSSCFGRRRSGPFSFAGTLANVLSSAKLSSAASCVSADPAPPSPAPPTPAPTPLAPLSSSPMHQRVCTMSRMWVGLASRGMSLRSTRITPLRNPMAKLLARAAWVEGVG